MTFDLRLETMNETTNVTLVGVGGQGILLTADVLARTAAEAGLDVKKSEIHGMSQRGGSVSSQVRFGARVHSPIIPEGETDLLVAFDAVEAVRAFPSVRPAASTPSGVSRTGAMPSFDASFPKKLR